MSPASLGRNRSVLPLTDSVFLHFKGNLQAAADLLEQGADPNAKDHAGWTPLVIMSSSEQTLPINIKQVRVLNISRPAQHALCEEFRHVTLCCLAVIWQHEACNHGHAAIAELLLDRGALLDMTGGFDHDTPLHDAVVNGHVQVAKLLVERGASLDIRFVQ